MIEREFTSTEVRRIVQKLCGPDCLARLCNLAYYKSSGLVDPAGKETYRGRKKFTFGQLLALAFIMEFRRQGLTAAHMTEPIARVARAIRLISANSDLHIITDGYQVTFSTVPEPSKGEAFKWFYSYPIGQLCYRLHVSVLQELDYVSEAAA